MQILGPGDSKSADSKMQVRPPDIRNEWRLAGVGSNDASSEEANEFVTPRECFSKSTNSKKVNKGMMVPHQ